jgi:hypothetical protein
LGETKQAEAALARLKSTYYRDTGVTLDHILKEEVFYEDASILGRFRAALQRINGEE